MYDSAIEGDSASGRAPGTVSFEQRVALVTGAGQGLGRAHALGLAQRGAKVMVNDIGVDGEPGPAALETVALIRAGGGEALASGADVADYAQVEAMVAATLAQWGRVDILINNAGILRDQSFAKMSPEHFSQVVDVHLKGSFNVSRALWATLQAQGYGRIVMTTSSSGLFGNFGQANYAAAKMGLVGLMNTLAIEGKKDGIHTNCILPIARTAMTEGLLANDVLDLFDPADVTAAVLALSCDAAPNRLILSAGGGCFGASLIQQTEGVYLASRERTPEAVLAQLPGLLDDNGARAMADGTEHTLEFVRRSAEASGLDLSALRWGAQPK